MSVSIYHCLFGVQTEKGTVSREGAVLSGGFWGSVVSGTGEKMKHNPGKQV